MPPREEAESKRIENLFHRLDKQNQGFLDAAQFEAALKSIEQLQSNSHSLPQLTKAVNDHSTKRKEYSSKLVSQCDKSKDGKVSLQEFKQFITVKEKELYLLFCKIAGDGDGDVKNATLTFPNPNLVIRKDKFQAYLKNNRIAVSESDLDKFLDAVDQKNDGKIDFTEWRDFFFLLPHPATSIQSVFQFYNSVADVDFNSDSAPIPIRISDAGWSINFKYLLAGGIAGAVSRTATAPLDRLKVLLQTSTQTHRSFSQLVSIKKGILKIYRDGGIVSFFKGNGLNIIKIMPESALKFYVFEQAKDTLSDHNNVSKSNLSLTSRFLAGGIAGLVSQLAIFPIETVKTRIMSQINNTRSTSLESTDTIQSPRDSSALRAARNLFREGGVRAFYRGCGPALIGIVPYAGVDLGVFETLKNTWLQMYKPGGDNVVPIHVVLGCGMFSGSCGAVLMYPLSLVRTRLQAQGTPSHPTYYSSVFDVIRKTYAHEGLVGFYRGLAPTLLKVLPAVSISYLVYERTKSSLDLSS